MGALDDEAFMRKNCVWKQEAVCRHKIDLRYIGPSPEKGLQDASSS